MTRRFPGFDVLDQAPHWDQVTKDLIEARVRTSPPAVTFFTADERGCAHALLNDLTGQDRDDAPVPVTQMVEARLAAASLGDKVTVTVSRAGQDRDVQVTLGELPAS